MSFSIFCYVLGAKEDIHIPGIRHFLVETEHFRSDFDRCSGEFSFATMQEGGWVNLLNSKNSYLGAFELCDADFEYPSELIKFPY